MTTVGSFTKVQMTVEIPGKNSKDTLKKARAISAKLHEMAKEAEIPDDGLTTITIWTTVDQTGLDYSEY